jgi:hypothetical protein
VTIYRITNKARGAVFEVTWFRQGERKRKSFRDQEEALKHAETTVKLLDNDRAELTGMCSSPTARSFSISAGEWISIGLPLSLARAR